MKINLKRTDSTVGQMLTVAMILAFLTTIGVKAQVQPRPRMPTPNAQTNRPGTERPDPRTKTVAQLPDLVVNGSGYFSGSKCPGDYALNGSWAAAEDNECFGLQIANVGSADAGASSLQILVYATDGPHPYLRSIPPIKVRQTQWVPLKATSLKIYYPAGFTSYDLGIKGISATVDSKNQIAEANEKNNTFSETEPDDFGNECDLRLATGSKAYVLNGKLYLNLFFWNSSPPGTCSSQSSVSVRVFPSDSGFSLLDIPASKLPGASRSWGKTSLITQLPCDANCQKACGSANAAKSCEIDVIVQESASYYAHFGFPANTLIKTVQ